jgi:hypothetical protein
MDASGEVVDVSGVVMDVSGVILDASGNPLVAPPPPPPPSPITLDDILNATQVVAQKELADKARLDAIGGISIEFLRNALIQWGALGFPNAYVIWELTIAPPPVCSDGVVRTLNDYIPFCSGKTLSEHTAVLQAKVASDIQIGFTNLGGSIGIVVTRA